MRGHETCDASCPDCDGCIGINPEEEYKKEWYKETWEEQEAHVADFYTLTWSKPPETEECWESPYMEADIPF